MPKTVSQEEKELKDKVLLISREMFLALLVFIVSLVAFIIIAYRVFRLQRSDADERAFAFANLLVSDVMSTFMQGITFFGSHYFLVPANILLITFFVLKRNSRYSIKVTAIALSSLLIMSGLKVFFNRPRPVTPLLEAARGLSFPSGHSFMSVCFYGLVMLIIWKEERTKPVLKWTLTLLTFLFVILIGFSRIYLRVHYFTDVLAGFSIGFSWLWISSFLLDQIKPKGLRKE